MSILTNINKSFKSLNRAIEKNAPELLLGVGLVAMIGGTILAAKASPKAFELLEKEKIDKKRKLTKIEIVKTTYKQFLPSILTTTAGVVCIVGMHKIKTKRFGAMAAAYALQESSFKKYKEIVRENTDEETRENINNQYIKSKMKNVGDSVIICGNGMTTYCYDSYSGRYFMGDIQKIEKTVIDLSHKLLGGDYITLNEFYYDIGLKEIKGGDNIGWQYDRKIDMEYSSQLDEYNRPCVVLDYDVTPL